MGNQQCSRECDTAAKTCAAAAARQDIVVCGASTDEILLGCRSAASVMKCDAEPSDSKRSRLNQQLLTAARTGDVAGLQVAILNGAVLETRRPLRISAVSSQGRRHRGPQGMTPLMRAAYEGHRDCVALLLEAKACCDAEDEDGLQPLHFAAVSGHLQVGQLLLNARADPTARDQEDRDAIAHLPDTSKDPEIRQWQELLQQALSRYGKASAKPAGLFGGRLKRDEAPTPGHTKAESVQVEKPTQARSACKDPAVTADIPKLPPPAPPLLDILTPVDQGTSATETVRPR